MKYIELEAALDSGQRHGGGVARSEERSAGRRRAGLGLGFAAGLALSGLTIASPAAAQTQIFSQHGFLQAPNVEVGVRPNGAFGSTIVPAGFHANVGSCLGFIVSRYNDGFSGAQIDGDFFCPGEPIEGWALTVGGATAINDNYMTQIPGSVGSAVQGPPTHAVTWSAAAPFHGVAVSQVYSVEDAGQSLTMTVNLTNTTGSTISGVRYARFVDPDNARAAEAYTTTNVVVSQGAGARVTASFPNGSLMALTSPDSRTQVAYSSNFGPAKTPDAILGGGDWIRTTGSTVTADILIGLAIDVGDLPAGAVETFTISYPLTEAALPPPPPPPIVVPTMTEWAMILFGLLLAGGAAVLAHHRRTVA